MERRKFIQLMAGASVACGLGGAAAAQKWFLMTEEGNAVGPRLIDGLEARPSASGYGLYQSDQLVFRVNKFGAQLLALADGHTPFQTIAARQDLGKAEDIVMFFFELGEAGYLHQQVEASLVESRV